MGHTPSWENGILFTCSNFLAGNRREETMVATCKNTRIEYTLGLENPGGGGHALLSLVHLAILSGFGVKLEQREEA